MMEERQTVLRGELALCIAVLMNSFGVVLMLYSGRRASRLFPVCPLPFPRCCPCLTLGTWTYLFQGLPGARA